MVAINHEAPTVWIMLPKEETTEAHQKSANARCWNGANVVVRQRSKREVEDTLIDRESTAGSACRGL
ncbi:MAG: hypothetical protein RLZZ36_636 [Pseudomonadota bacterium]|jgi:hypothetical protein